LSRNRVVSKSGLTELSRYPLLNFGLAPLNSRRDVAMLGVIHRTVLGLGPKHFLKFIQRADESNHPTGRVAMHSHDKQLRSYRTGNFLQIIAHSILGAIDVYNLLPQYVIAAMDVSTFRNRLQQILKVAARDRVPGWTTILFNRHWMFRHPLLDFSGFNGMESRAGGDNKDGGVKRDDAHTCIEGWINFGND